MVTGPAPGPAICWAAAEQKEFDMTENGAGKQQADGGATCWMRKLKKRRFFFLKSCSF